MDVTLNAGIPSRLPGSRGHSNILGNEIADYVAKKVFSENAQLPGVTYTSICARVRHMVKDSPIQHERTVEVYSAHSSPLENARYEAEATKLYRQNSVLESTKDCALTKAS